VNRYRHRGWRVLRKTWIRGPCFGHGETGAAVGAAGAVIGAIAGALIPR